MLPRMPHRDMIHQTQAMSFGGINRNPAAGDGSVFWTMNMGADRMPLLSPRKPRWRVGIYSECNGITAYNGLYMVLGDTVYKDGEALGELEQTGAKRRFAQMNGQILVFPDKKIIRADQTSETDTEDAEWPTEELIAEDVRVEIGGGYILATDVRNPTDWTQTSLRPGNQVMIRGSAPENNKKAQVLEITETELRFASDTFEPTAQDTITVIKCFAGSAPAPGMIEDMNLDVVSDGGLTPGITVRFCDGIYGRDRAEANTIEAEDLYWASTGLRAGDAVRIDAGEGSPNNKTVVIREIDGKALRFYENSFTNTPEGETVQITIHRSVPDMDGIFTHENRLWGWKGNTIYCSKLGDPLNFEVFDGLSTDSWTLELDGPGDILGAIVYQGYPTFFKEERVYRVYGDRPSQYRLMETSAMGIHPGCGESPAIVGDTLFYVTRNGMAAFNGGYSRDVHAPLGELRFTKARACSDGRRYYLSAMDANAGAYSLYVYDTVWDAWFVEDGLELTGFAVDRGNLYFINRTGYLWLDGHAAEAPKGAEKEDWPKSYVEFGDFTGANWSNRRTTGNPNRKGTSKLLLRVTLAPGSTLMVQISFDGGPRELVKVLEAQGKRSYYLPIIPRRSDHYRLYLSGAGDWTLDSLVREEYSGSPLH